MSNKILLGQLASEETRDAIHIAIVAVKATEELNPGDHVGLVSGEATKFLTEEHLGIVDPYLKAPVKRGELFYLLLYPNTVTDMKHVWSHPAFKEQSIVNKNKASLLWIENYANTLGLKYEELMDGADKFIADDEHMYKSGEDDSPGSYGFFESISTDPEFWTHYEIVTGIEVDKKHRVNFFSCSC